MRQLVAVEFLSIDGVMQGLGSPEEDRDGGFEHGGWGLEYGTAMHEVVAGDGFEKTSAYVFGRRTYEKLAAFWPDRSADDPMAASLNSTPKFVATRTLTELDWAGSRLLQGDLIEALQQLKAHGDGEVVILGSGDLLRQLIAADLVDELRLFVHPLLLGSGKRLFGELPAPRAFELMSVATTSLGTIAATYALSRREEPG